MLVLTLKTEKFKCRLHIPEFYWYIPTLLLYNIGYNDDDCGISFEVPNLALSSSLSASEHIKHQFSPCCWVNILLQNILNISSPSAAG